MSTRFGQADVVIAALLAACTMAAACNGYAQSAPEPPAAPSPRRAEDPARSYADAKDRTAAHVRAGRFKDAVADAEETARLSETVNGSDSQETAVALHNLGFVLRRAGAASKAREPLERALSIYERLLPAVHPDTRNVIGELGQIYIAMGRGQVLADIYTRLVARAEREGEAQHVGVAHLLANQGFVLRGLKNADEAQAAFARALDIYEARGEITGLAYLQTLEAVLDRLDETRHAAEADARAKTALSALAGRGAAGAPNAVAIYERLSRTTLEAGRGAEAKAHAEAALALLSEGDVPARAGRADPRIGALNNLARASRAIADHAGAEQAYKRAIALLEASGDKANAGIVTDNLAVLYLYLGRVDEAERLNKRALALLDEALGRDHPSVGRAAGNLGAMLNEAGRRGEAEPLLRRALAIAEAQPKQDAVQIGIVEDNLAGLLRQSGRGQEARAHYDRALRLFERALPEKHPRIATVRNNFGRYLFDIGRYDDAEAALLSGLELSEAIYGKDNFNTAIPAANLGEVYTALGRHAEARHLLTRALAALETAYGASHANLLATLSAAGRLELADGRPAAARAYFERAVAIVVESRSRSGLREGGNGPEEGRRAFHGLIEALWHEGASGQRNAALALEIAQLDSMTPTAAALAALGARAGAADPALGVLTRERQDLAAEWIAADKRMTQLLSATDAQGASEQRQLKTRLAAIDARLAAIDADLARRFPRYHELARPIPLSVDILRRLIGPGEAAIQIAVTREAAHVFAVTGSEVKWARAAITEGELATLVRNLRCGLDRSEWSGDGAARCARLTGVDVAPTDTDPLPFDLSGAHGLYRILFEPLAEAIAGKDLLVVASGALTSLPLQVLITEAPPPGVSDTTTASGRLLTDATSRLHEIAWLGRRHATTVLPSLASLAPLRQLARTSAGREPYLGVGNPLLTGPSGTDYRASEVPACRIGHDVMAAAPTPVDVASATPPQKASVRTSASPVALRAARGSTDVLRRQTPLPETADELCRVAGNVRASAASVVVGASATEAAVKAMSAEGRLADARIVHFATHGLLAGETALLLADKAEPSLMLTPPDTASDTDDGLLTASEVATLRLDADWVVLSACNTASGDEVGAEALSGLARAFFYAGARSLLVSHWAVDSDATVKLVTGAFDAMAREQGMSQARALSKAMAALIDSGDGAAHPSNWAPFVVVGGSAPAELSAPVAGQTVSPVSSRARAAKPGAKRSSQRKPRGGTPADAADWRNEVFQR